MKYINDRAWVAEWKSFTTRYPGLPAPPDQVLARHRRPRPNCLDCWDTGLCRDCLGEHPQYCSAPECEGYCNCAAGRAHRAAYAQSLIDYGLRKP